MLVRPSRTLSDLTRSVPRRLQDGLDQEMAAAVPIDVQQPHSAERTAQQPDHRPNVTVQVLAIVALAMMPAR